MSALIHAATMVVAGVYLIARMYPVFFNGLHIGTGNINYVAFIGAFTTVFGASLAFVQFDIKRVLAYSTISQLGYMVMGLGVGAWTGGVFHLFTHAYFKACLFLCAGSVSHAAHHTFDMREMGGLRKHQTHDLLVLHHRHAGPRSRSRPSRGSGRRTRSWPGPRRASTAARTGSC